MKQYYVELSATTWIKAIVEAESEDEAYQIAHALDPDDCFQETECYDLVELSEIEGEDFDYPILRQNEYGYEVVKEEN